MLQGVKEENGPMYCWHIAFNILYYLIPCSHKIFAKENRKAFRIKDIAKKTSDDYKTIIKSALANTNPGRNTFECQHLTLFYDFMQVLSQLHIFAIVDGHNDNGRHCLFSKRGF